MKKHAALSSFLFFIALMLLWHCRSSENDDAKIKGLAFDENNIQVAQGRSDSLQTYPPSIYLTYLKEVNGDTTLLKQAFEMERQVRDSILSLPQSGMAIYLPEGGYNPEFVTRVNEIVDNSSLPEIFKDHTKKRMLGIKHPMAD